MEEVEIEVIRRKKPSSIIVRDAYKRYGRSNYILNGLNLTVEEGTIYGFLGPSGCGKTTLLNCIVGRSELNSGSIRTSAKRRKDVGFMPQDISLFGNLTVLENFIFFGFLTGMSAEQIVTRANDLISFLEIPSKDRHVLTLSGGQQRRLSIAITLLHDPKIIILDEPTVGIDPILCHQIWEMLLVLAERGKSIIITTHYIQEAQQAHKIGLMRNGKLLAEENPNVLLDQYGCDDLENVFLKLIFEEQQNKGGDKSKSSNNVGESGTPRFKPSTRAVNVRFDEDNRFCSQKVLKALTYKNLIVMKRGYIHLLFTLILPLLQTYLFNIAIGLKPEEMKVAVLNNEISLRHCYPHVYSGCFFERNNTFASSCMLLKYLRDQNYKIEPYHDEDEAMDDVRHGDVKAVLRFSRNYTNRVVEKISRGALHQYDESFLDGFVEVWVDNSERVLVDFIKYDIRRAVTSFLRAAVRKCGKNPDIAETPVVFQKAIRGDPDSTANGYISCALLIVGPFFFSSSATALFFITEKVGGQVERILIYGVTVFEIILALILFQGVISLTQSVLVMMITFIPFDNPLEGNFFVLLCLVSLTSISGILFGVVQGVISGSVTAAAYTGVGTSFILSVTSGMFGVREAQRKSLKIISGALPMTWEVEAARRIANRGSDFTQEDVFRGFYACVGYIGVFFLIIWYFTKYNSSALASHK